jgi:CRISPR-associated exonuclease Cas4
VSELAPNIGWLGLAFILALLAMVAWLGSRTRRHRSGLPQGELIYHDMSQDASEHETIFSPNLGLTGRPDYLVRDKDGSIVPVEVKSGYAPAEPYDGHVLQLAAYCLLVEEAYGVRPSHGILQYQDQSFIVDFSYDLEADLVDLLDAMRQDLGGREVYRDHEDPARCANCGFLAYCDHRLV